MEEITNQLTRIEERLSGLNVERFEKIEQQLKSIDNRLTILEEAHKESKYLEPQELSGKIKEKGHKFLSTVSVHGLPRILKTDNSIVKLVWTVMILTSVSAGLYIINRSVRDYYEYDVITNIERVTEQSVLFPAIAVCTKKYVNKYFQENGSYAGRDLTNEDIFKKMIGGFESPNGDTNLAKLEFFENINYNFSCLRFNGGNNSKAERVTNSSAHFMLTIINEYYNVDGFIYSFIDHPFYGVFVGDNFVNSYLNLVPLVLKKSQKHLITLEGTEIENKLCEPYNDCTDSEDVTYRQMNCIDICINREIMVKYNCSIPSYYTAHGLTQCSRPQSVINEFQHHCQYGCPRECDSTRYSFKHQDEPNESGDSTRFYFSLNDLSTFKITQIPKLNQFLLISNIGGSLGLFIGIRFLSIVEIVEFLIDVFYLIYFDF